MIVTRKIIKIDEELCDGCGQCVPSCAEGALEIIDGKAKVMADKYCDGLGACLGECPTGALSIIEREADEFDEEAVEEMLATRKPEQAQAPSGCPSAGLRILTPSSPCQGFNQPKGLAANEGSNLSHWPIKIRLIPPHAPFLKNADILVLADCCGGAYPHLNRDFIQGKVVMMGCPKFDEVPEYIQKFEQIFSTVDINSVTTVIMEVPCCSGMSTIVKKGMKAAGKEIPLKEVVIGLKGNIVKETEA